MAVVEKRPAQRLVETHGPLLALRLAFSGSGK
jgi:hypothetical protein